MPTKDTYRRRHLRLVIDNTPSTQRFRARRSKKVIRLNLAAGRIDDSSHDVRLRMALAVQVSQHGPPAGSDLPTEGGGAEVFAFNVFVQSHGDAMEPYRGHHVNGLVLPEWCQNGNNQMMGTNRIRELREARHLSQEQLAEQAGTTRQQIHKLEKGERKLTTDWMDRLAPPLGVEPVEIIVSTGAEISVSTSNRRGKRKPAPNGQVLIEELDVRAQGGAGGVHESDTPERVVSEWSLPAEVVRGQTSAPAGALKIITVYGDSMTPDFMPGERVLVDTEDRLPSPPGVFVMWDGFGLVIKRLEMVPYSDPPRVILRSKNDEYETRELELEGTHINGRVIGKWHWT